MKTTVRFKSILIVCCIGFLLTFSMLLGVWLAVSSSGIISISTPFEWAVDISKRTYCWNCGLENPHDGGEIRCHKCGVPTF